MTRSLIEGGLVLEKDFTIDIHSGQIITLTDKARDRYLEMFPMFTLNYAITEETDAGWQVVASLGKEPQA